MIHEIEPAVFNNVYQALPPQDDDLVFIFDGSDVQLRGNIQNGLYFPTVAEVPEYLRVNLRYAFAIDDTHYYVLLNHNHIGIKGCHWDNVKILRCDNPHGLCFAAVTALHLYQWYTQHQFCGVCGAPLEHLDNLRSLKCPQCKHQIFPKIMPAIIVGVTDHSRILITKYNQRTYRGSALIAGFCEIGETLEDAARREIREEVGLEVGELKYFGSQPWGFDQDLLAGFFAEVKGSIKIVREEQELSEALWIEAKDLPLETNPISLTKQMMMHFRNQFVAGSAT
ncbi:MAG: NAD(+) diphosphatase [Succinivibrio sp.]|nr:NAD(+) diphosphatase [Succinivibrio sp.]